MSQADYCRYYDSQRGGEIPVFRGGGQSGAGLGDILRGIFRSQMPVALRGIQSFAGSTLAGTQAGMSLPSAARAAIMPTISAVAGSAAPTISRLVSQIAPGLGGARATPQSGSGILFDGENGIPTTSKAVAQYKRATGNADDSASTAKKRKRSSQKQKQKGTHYNF